MVDGTDEAIAESYKTVREELIQYGAGLEEKISIPVLTKCDAIAADEIDERVKTLAKSAGCSPDKVHVISGVTGAGVEKLMRVALSHIHNDRKARQIRDAEKSEGIAP